MSAAACGDWTSATESDTLETTGGAATEAAVPQEPDSVSGIGITGVLAYRRHLGNEQWRVRWTGEPTEESWERYGMLDTSAPSCMMYMFVMIDVKYA